MKDNRLKDHKKKIVDVTSDYSSEESESSESDIEEVVEA